MYATTSYVEITWKIGNGLITRVLEQKTINFPNWAPLWRSNRIALLISPISAFFYENFPVARVQKYPRLISIHPKQEKQQHNNKYSKRQEDTSHEHS